MNVDNNGNNGNNGNNDNNYNIGVQSVVRPEELGPVHGPELPEYKTGPKYGPEEPSVPRWAFTAALRNQEVAAPVLEVGTRAGCRNGWGVERRGEQMEVVRYGPDGHDPYPRGERREVHFVI